MADQNPALLLIPPSPRGERGSRGGEAGFFSVRAWWMGAGVGPFRRNTELYRHLSPAACLTPFALLFPLFFGGEGYIRLHLVIQRALCLRQPQRGGKGSQSIGKTPCPFWLELEEKKKRILGDREYKKKKKTQ